MNNKTRFLIFILYMIVVVVVYSEIIIIISEQPKSGPVKHIPKCLISPPDESMIQDQLIFNSEIIPLTEIHNRRKKLYTHE